MKLFGMCIDKRVVIGVIATAGLVWWLAPNAFVAALPFLLIAICPLSMLLMMKAMNRPNAEQAAQTAASSPSPAPDHEAVSAAAADVDARRN